MKFTTRPTAASSGEAKASAALRSENIVQVYDLTEIDGAPAIVMEFVEGKSLMEILQEQGVQMPEFARKVAVEVLKGLAVAHSKGIIHRDIKPGNILVENSGGIKVTDFGLATVPRSPVLTLDGMVLGTPAYMSPEQAKLSMPGQIFFLLGSRSSKSSPRREFLTASGTPSASRKFSPFLLRRLKTIFCPSLPISQHSSCEC